jgi:hypothetical protein
MKAPPCGSSFHKPGCDLCAAQLQKRTEDALRAEQKPTLQHRPFAALQKDLTHPVESRTTKT